LSRLIARDVGQTYSSARGDVEALRNVSFEVGRHEFVSIVGPSGCGKTTLLKVIAGLMEPTRGRVDILERSGARQACGLVFQDHGLLPWRSVLENVGFGLQLGGMPREEWEQKARSFLDRIGLGGFLHHYPHELSAGMRQRVGIARAFVTDCDVLLLDEPFGALDAQTKLVLHDELLRLWRDDRRSVVHVTHDIEEAIILGDRVLVMSGRPGSILEDVPVPIPRPRDARSVHQISDLRWHVWGLLERTVRETLCIR
jgi:NitT/TauT family transport system ATP-binding protein